MRPDGRNPVNLTPNSAANDSWPNWRADGRKIAFRSNRETPGNSVPEGFERPDFVMNADGSHVRQTTFNELLKPSRDLGARDLLVLARPPLETRLCQGAPGNNLVSSLVAIPVLGLPRSY